jgi:hypothetical protein
LDTVRGWCNLLRVRKSGVLQRHRHPMAVTGYVIGTVEIPRARLDGGGRHVRHSAGRSHTLTVPADCPEMITFFSIAGAMIYLDPNDGIVGYEDVFTKIEMCRAHYVAIGLGSGFVDAFVR